MHVDRYVNVYRLEEFKIVHCGLEKINRSENDACASLQDYPHSPYTTKDKSIFIAH